MTDHSDIPLKPSINPTLDQALQNPSALVPVRKVFDVTSASELVTWKRCKRRHWFQYVARVTVPQKASAARGTAWHTEVEVYLKGGAKPKEPAVVQALPHVPPPGPQVFPEQRFEMECVPGTRIRGFLDVLDLRDACNPRVLDLKTTVDFRWAKAAHEIATDTQMVTYGVHAQRQVQDATLGCVAADSVTCTLLYIKARGAPDVRPVSYRFTREALQDAWETHVKVPAVSAGKSILIQRWQDAEPNPDACGDYGGCPFKPVCGLTSGSNPSSSIQHKPAPPMSMAALNERLFNVPILPPDAPKSATTAPTAPTAPVQVTLAEPIEHNLKKKQAMESAPAAAETGPRTVTLDLVNGGKVAVGIAKEGALWVARFGSYAFNAPTFDMALGIAAKAAEVLLPAPAADGLQGVQAVASAPAPVSPTLHVLPNTPPPAPPAAPTPTILEQELAASTELVKEAKRVTVTQVGRSRYKVTDPETNREFNIVSTTAEAALQAYADLRGQEVADGLPPTAAPKKRGRPKKEAAAAADMPVFPDAQAVGPSNFIAPMEAPAPAVQVPGGDPPMRPAPAPAPLPPVVPDDVPALPPKEAAPPAREPLVLFLDCMPVKGVSFPKYLTDLVDAIHVQLCAAHDCEDMRLKYKFGEWKALLVLAVRKAALSGVVIHRSGGQLEEVALEALLPVAHTVIQGVK